MARFTDSAGSWAVQGHLATLLTSEVGSDVVELRRVRVLESFDDEPHGEPYEPGLILMDDVAGIQSLTLFVVRRAGSDRLEMRRIYDDMLPLSVADEWRPCALVVEP